MTIEAGQIYFLRKAVNVGEADYPRPCLVLRASKHDATMFILGALADVEPEYFKGAKLLGRATGEFKKRVEDWYGLPLS